MNVHHTGTVARIVAGGVAGGLVWYALADHRGPGVDLLTLGGRMLACLAMALAAALAAKRLRRHRG